MSSGKKNGNEASVSDRMGAIADYSKNRFQTGASDLGQRVKGFDPKDALDAVLDAPERFKREWQKHGATGAITKFPIATVIIFLLITSFFVTQSGFLDGTEFDDDPDNSALNVNGDMEVYLPEGSPVGELIKMIEEDWTTNVMVVYIELGDDSDRNITDKRILQEIDYVEKELNPHISNSVDDPVIYILSLSTVLKEVNSSAPRVREAIVTELGQLGCLSGQDDCASAQAAGELNELLKATDAQFGGGYEIPSQQTIDLIVQEMYEDDGTASPGLDKLARDVKGSENGGPDGKLDRAIMAVAVAVSDEENKTAKDLIENTQAALDRISKLERACEFDENGAAVDGELCTWEDFDLTMTLTGAVPITNAVTEFSFVLFWEIFPVACILVALGLFVFHSDILQTGLNGIRPLQGIKVVIIAGLPTLCAVFWTLGIIGFTNYEVTMTVIIVGPILLALGVSYGLHITNRYAEEGGTKHEKMKASLSSTGKAVFLSAVTTVIGFISLVFTPMAPIQTVGIALSGGIVVVYFLTMFMVPNLTLILDLRKPKHPPLKVFKKMVEIPVKHNVPVIAIFLILILFSSTVGQQNVQENIDLLGMAPEGELSVQKMKQYSKEFEAGQIGMILINANVSGDINDGDPANDDPASNLDIIDVLEGKLNGIENTSAVSIVFLMKSTGIEVAVSGSQLYEFIDNTPLPDDIKQTAQVLLDRDVTADASFWDLLMTPEDYGLPGTKQSQIFLLDVFYASITKETREIFVNEDFDRTLIFVDMPFVPVAETSKYVDQVNLHAESFRGGHGETAEDLTGVAATVIEVNELIVGSQWTSLGFAIILTLITLAIVFRDIRYSFWTTSPVIATVALQWLFMWQLDVPLSLVTVMIGSILVGVGVDFSIHIANRIKELGGGIPAIKSAAIGTGMSLFEAATVTSLGLITAKSIPIPEIQPFINVIIILLWVAAASALILLPAIFVTLEKMGIGSVGGPSGMAKKLGLGAIGGRNEIDVLDAALVDDVIDSW
ncbi:MAG: MMPL family transporter [Euryarchaeota archaeon]|jgi:predicted RND superfamily exporter protein|nr:MMPL family transporter [Euryarchaeota archaeon]